MLCVVIVQCDIVLVDLPAASYGFMKRFLAHLKPWSEKTEFHKLFDTGSGRAVTSVRGVRKSAYGRVKDGKCPLVVRHEFITFLIFRDIGQTPYLCPHSLKF